VILEKIVIFSYCFEQGEKNGQKEIVEGFYLLGTFIFRINDRM